MVWTLSAIDASTWSAAAAFIAAIAAFGSWCAATAVNCREKARNRNLLEVAAPRFIVEVDESETYDECGEPVLWNAELEIVAALPIARISLAGQFARVLVPHDSTIRHQGPDFEDGFVWLTPIENGDKFRIEVKAKHEKLDLQVEFILPCGLRGKQMIKLKKHPRHYIQPSI